MKRRTLFFISLNRTMDDGSFQSSTANSLKSGLDVIIISFYVIAYGTGVGTKRNDMGAVDIFTNV